MRAGRTPGHPRSSSGPAADLWLVPCDARGRLHLIDGRTGEEVDQIRLGPNIEASLAMFGNRLVIGTGVDNIYAVEVR